MKGRYALNLRLRPHHRKTQPVGVYSSREVADKVARAIVLDNGLRAEVVIRDYERQFGDDWVVGRIVNVNGKAVDIS